MPDPTTTRIDPSPPKQWTAASVREALGDRLDQAMTIASAIVQADFQGERGVVISGGNPAHNGSGYTAIDYSLTHRQIIAEGDKDEVTAAALAHIALTGAVSIEFLQACVISPESSRAFAHGVFVAIQLMEQQAREAGIHPETSEHMGHEICSTLGLRRGRDLRRELEMAGWDEESAAVAGNIHSQLMAKGYAGWTAEDAEQCLRGGADARGGLDDLEARLGIDVDRMRVAITFIGPDVGDPTLEELCEAHDFTIRKNELRSTEMPAWDWVNKFCVSSSVYFDSWREAAVDALETAFADDWIDSGRDDAFIDYVAQINDAAPRP